jgi:cyanate lyase
MKTHIGKALAAKRKEKGHHWTDVGREFDVSSPMIHQIASGTRALPEGWVRAMARYLEVEPFAVLEMRFQDNMQRARARSRAKTA